MKDLKRMQRLAGLITESEYSKHISNTDSKKPVEDIDEGFMDRMSATLKGVGAQASTSFKNLGAFLKGDKGAIQDTKLAGSLAILKQKANTLKKDIEDAQKDIQKLFPKEVAGKLPKEFAQPLANYIKALNSIKATNDMFVTGNITSSAKTPKENPKKESNPTVAQTKPEKTQKREPLDKFKKRDIIFPDKSSTPAQTKPEKTQKREPLDKFKKRDIIFPDKK
jgi:hypothetical protein